MLLKLKKPYLPYAIFFRLKIPAYPDQNFFGELRSKNIYQLGKVKRVYIEASGDHSIYEADEGKPGLSVLPPFDFEVEPLFKQSANNIKACTCCGNVQQAEVNGSFSLIKNKEKIRLVYTPGF